MYSKQLVNLHDTRPSVEAAIFMYMWQSRVEIEHYSVAYFDRITAFEVLYRSTSIKGGAHTRYVDLSGIDVASLCI